ncbi:hypothetical protein SteCoe_32381 [Stentor coeruleus]|uniref:Calmodulin n=1 Tax=Stentor coeruleus TaxID=5963 RepID=A0A1R2AZ57_9CILI|nr:hypothetical protein SteCoe_32381 [Stentor coeruleus]
MANSNPLAPSQPKEGYMIPQRPPSIHEGKVSMEALAPTSFAPIPKSPAVLSAPVQQKLSPEVLAPSAFRKPDFEPPPTFQEGQESREFFHSKTVAGPFDPYSEEPNLRPVTSSSTFKKPAKNPLAPGPKVTMTASMQRKKTRPNTYEKMPEKDKADAYFRLQEENMQLKKDHLELEKSIKTMKNQFQKLEKNVKLEREIAENYTGKDFKSSLIDNQTNNEALRSENKLLLQENKILIKAALTGNLNKQLLSRIEGPALNKFSMKPKVLSGAVMFDIKREQNSPPREPTPPPPKTVYIENDYYKYEYEKLFGQFSELQKLLQLEQEKNLDLENRIKGMAPDDSNEIKILKERIRVLEKQLADALESPFLKDDSKLKVLQTEIFGLKEGGVKAEKIIAQLREQIALLIAERDRYKEEFLVLQARVQVKENYMKEFETQLRSIGGMDLNAFMKALGLMKLRGDEPAWSQLDFLEQGTAIPNDLNSLRREVERLKLEKGQLAAEVEKAQSLLVLKNEMEKEKQAMYESEIEQLKIQLRSAQQRTEELARLADYRANRVINLERNQRLNIYDEDNRIVGTKTQITVGELNNAAPEFMETGTEVAHNENILDLWLGEAEYYQTALENTLRGQVSLLGTFISFLTVDFFNMETQSTSLCESLRPKYNIHISFKLTVTDFFIKTLESGYIYLEGHASKGDSHLTFARCQIPLKELLLRSGATSEMNTKTGVIESMATYVSNFDGKTSVGTQNYKIRMRYPLSEAMRWYKEKEEIIELANPKQFALDTIYTYSGPTKTRELIIRLFKCVGLKGQVYPGNLRPFIFFQFFTEPETFSNLSVGPDPVYDQTFKFTVTTTPELKRYLDTETLEILVFDDNAPIREGGQDIIGTAKIPLNSLLLDTAIEGTYILYNFRGLESGKITIGIAWKDSKADQLGYGSPLTEVWEREVYERIAKSLSSRGLGLDSSFSIFDQDQDGLISPQEFRNTLLITLRLPLSEQEIQLLINAINLVEGGITRTIFRQKFSGLLPADRALQQEESWEETILDKVRRRIQEKGLNINQAFSAFDENSDGFISGLEFIKAFRIMDLGLVDSEIERIFKYFDPRGTNRIDYRVFFERVGVSPRRDSSGRSWEEAILDKVRRRIQEKGLNINQAFSAFDENSDGFISGSEFIKAFRIMQLGLTDEEIEKLLKYFDPRGTNKIDYRVFFEKVGVSTSSERSWEERIIEKVRQRIKEKNLSVREAFAAFDENKDGTISASEFIKTFRIMQLGLTDEEIEKLLRYFDPRRTGSINHTTFCDKILQSTQSTPVSKNRWEEQILEKVRKRIREKNLSIRQAFSAFDENKDGMISPSEFIKTFRVMELGLTDDEIESLLSYFNPSKSGNLDYRIFCSKLQDVTIGNEEEILNRVNGRIKEKNLSIRDAFRAFDENKDGIISYAEFIKTFKIMELGISEIDIDKLYNFFDPERTGKIDYRVFCEKIHPTSVRNERKESTPDGRPWEEAILDRVRQRIREKNLSVRKAFAAFDENADGMISPAEFVKTFKIMDIGLTEDEIVRLMGYFDPRKTGSINYRVFCDKIQDSSSSRSFEERKASMKPGWEEAIISQVRNRIKEKNLSLRQAFAAFDENSDGMVSANEFIKAFKAMELGLTDEEILNLMGYFDPRRTGTINYRIFCQKIQEENMGSTRGHEDQRPVSGKWEEAILEQVRKRIREKGISIWQTFTVFDSNRDGLISGQEFVRTFRSMELGISENDINQLLRHFDPQLTNKINYKTFCEKIQDKPLSRTTTENFRQTRFK